MKTKTTALLLAVMLVISSLLFSSCSGESEYPVKLDSITIEKEPENIVILNRNIADIVSQLGYDIKMVGRSDEVNQKGIEVVPSVGSATSPSVASIDEVKADIVFADNTLDSAIAEKIGKKGIPVVTLEDANTQKQVKSLYKKLGRILGGNISGTKTGNEKYKDMISTLKDVKEAAVTDISVVRTAAYLYIDNGVLNTFNSGNWGSQVLSFTGASNVFKNNENDLVDNEKLALANPDFIFCADENTKKYIASCDSLKKLSALKDKTFIIPREEITMQGITTLNIVQTMLKDMYPEEFSD